MTRRPPATITRLVQIAQAAHCASHGGKAAIYAAACAELGMSPATLQRALAEVALRPIRKQRADAGESALVRDDAIAISALLMESMRKHGKRLLSIDQAVQILRANGVVRAECIDQQTGEITPLSSSAIARALRGYRLHPDQLLAPTPHVELQSLHPNHVWQIDASLCVLYYLHARSDAESGLQVMPADRFYKNKPHNLRRIEDERVWSYEVTDHFSDCLFLTYVMGAESGANLCDSFIEAITPRADDPFHGVPLIAMMDLGSVPAMFLNLLRRLQVRALPHAAGNARATGQVENARNLIECKFESALRLRPVRDLAELKATAWRWARHYNATAVHTRHGRTRTAQWLTITEQQLRIAPPVDTLRALVSAHPVRRKVVGGGTGGLLVEFGGAQYDVSQVPRVMVGEWLMVCPAPYHADSALVVDTDADGHELLHVVPRIQRDAQSGFAVGANVIGEDWRRPAATLADTHRAEVAQAALGTGTVAELAARRKRIARGQELPFGGRIDPHKPVTDAPPLPTLPKRGVALQPTATPVTPPMAADVVMTHFQAARALAARGVAMDVERNAQVAAWHPDGVPESALDDLVRRLTVRAGLRVVGGAL